MSRYDFVDFDDRVLSMPSGSEGLHRKNEITQSLRSSIIFLAH